MSFKWRRISWHGMDNFHNALDGLWTQQPKCATRAYITVLTEFYETCCYWPMWFISGPDSSLLAERCLVNWTVLYLPNIQWSHMDCRTELNHHLQQMVSCILFCNWRQNIFITIEHNYTFSAESKCFAFFQPSALSRLSLRVRNWGFVDKKLGNSSILLWWHRYLKYLVHWLLSMAWHNNVVMGQCQLSLCHYVLCL